MTRVVTVTLNALILLVSPSVALALTTFSDRSQWEMAVGPYEIEDFESTLSQREQCSEFLDFGGCAHSNIFSTPKLEIEIPIGSDLMHQIGNLAPILTVNGSQAFYSDLHGQILVAGISFNTIRFSQAITSFAVDLANVYDDCEVFYGGNCFEGFSTTPLTFSINGIDTAIAHGSDFFGVVSELPFDSIIMRNTNPAVGLVVRPVFDDIRFVPVPEPQAALLIALGIMVLSFRQVDRAA